jgi:hypothetical protein
MFIRFFFSLLLFIHFYRRSFSRATGFENSPLAGVVESAFTTPYPFSLLFSKSDSSFSFSFS